MTRQKTGLVIEGGGMKCAYSAGVLDRFLDDGITFDYVIGVSAGAANGASYLAGQRDRNRRFYTDHIHEKGYFGLRSFLKTGDLFGLDYIYSSLTNSDGGDPLDFDRMLANPAEYELVTTNARTGRPEYFSKTDMKKDDYTLVKASCCLPAACRARKYRGQYYYDGGLSDPIPADRALQKGCGRVVVILSKPRGYDKKPETGKWFYSLACRKYPVIVDMLNNRHISYMKQYNRIFELESEGRAFVFAQSTPLPSGTFRMDEAENRRLYDLGIADYDRLSGQLADFLA